MTKKLTALEVGIFLPFSIIFKSCFHFSRVSHPMFSASSTYLSLFFLNGEVFFFYFFKQAFFQPCLWNCGLKALKNFFYRLCVSRRMGCDKRYVSDGKAMMATSMAEEGEVGFVGPMIASFLFNVQQAHIAIVHRRHYRPKIIVPSYVNNNFTVAVCDWFESGVYFKQKITFTFWIFKKIIKRTCHVKRHQCNEQPWNGVKCSKTGFTYFTLLC